MALRLLEARRLIVPYASGKFRSLSYIVFASPIEEIEYEALLEGARDGLMRRLSRPERAQQLDLAEPKPESEVVLEEDGQQYSSAPEIVPLSTLALAVLDRMQRLSRGAKARLSPMLSLSQQVALGDAQLAGKCWFLLDALSQKVRYPESDLNPRAVQAALRELEAHGWIVPYGIGPQGGNAYLIFKSSVGNGTIARLWEVASDSFVSRMQRSRYVDRDKGEQLIAQRISEYGNQKENQQASGAAAFLNSSPDSLLPTGSKPVPPTASQSPAATNLTTALRQPPVASSSGRGLVDDKQVTLLQRLLGESGLSDQAAALAVQVDAQLRAVRCEHAPVLRYLERNAQVPLFERLATVAAQLGGVLTRKVPPRNPGGYLWSALVEKYPVPVPPAFVAAAERSAPAAPVESAAQRRRREDKEAREKKAAQRRRVAEEERQIKAALDRGLGLQEAIKRVNAGERFADELVDPVSAAIVMPSAVGLNAEFAASQSPSALEPWTRIVESVTREDFSAWEYAQAITCRLSEGVLQLSSPCLTSAELRVWKHVWWGALEVAAAREGLTLRWVAEEAKHAEAAVAHIATLEASTKEVSDAA
jgi:hypothetical protein